MDSQSKGITHILYLFTVVSTRGHLSVVSMELSKGSDYEYHMCMTFCGWVDIKFQVPCYWSGNALLPVF